MRVYFIRHGNTELNKRHIHQPPETGLSPEGELQAKRVGEALKNEKIEKIFSSDLPRAKRTADIIAEAVGVSVEESTQLREIRRPEALYGKSHFHPASIWYVLATITHHKSPTWHYGDAESLFELRVRAQDVVEHLESISTAYSNIAVVSHAVFLEILIAFVCKEKNTSLLDYFPIFSPLSPIKNSSITTLEYIEHENSNVCTWLPVTYNSIKHLKA